MTPVIPIWMAPAWLFGVTLSTVWSGRRSALALAPTDDASQVLPQSTARLVTPVLVVQLALLLLALVATDGRVAFAALAIGGALLAVAAQRISRTASVYLWGAAACSAVAAASGGTTANGDGIGATVVLAVSLLSIALRAGLFPFHAGVAALSERASPRQMEQIAALPVYVFVHLRFADHGALAHDLAPLLVAIGGVSTLLFALTALAHRDLRRLYVASTLMHGGMLFAAVGAAGRGHHAAALLVVVTMVLALAGFSAMLSALEARAGAGEIPDFVGRARAFPRLAAAMAFFGGAAVGLPGTAGFVADDLLLHALWEESVWTAVAVIVASALLAVATLSVFARVFFGAPQRHLAPDLLGPERRIAVVLMVLLLTLGFVPVLLVSPVNALLQ